MRSEVLGLRQKSRHAPGRSCIEPCVSTCRAGGLYSLHQPCPRTLRWPQNQERSRRISPCLRCAHGLYVVRWKVSPIDGLISLLHVRCYLFFCILFPLTSFFFLSFSVLLFSLPLIFHHFIFSSCYFLYVTSWFVSE